MTYEQIEDWLKKYNIKNYVINDDLSVDVNRDVNISCENLKEIPIQFGHVTRNFYCDNNQLTSLKGCPTSVNGHFHCYDNNLTSLKHCPTIINGDFDCDDRLTNDPHYIRYLISKKLKSIA